MPTPENRWQKNGPERSDYVNRIPKDSFPSGIRLIEIGMQGGDVIEGALLSDITEGKIVKIDTGDGTWDSYQVTAIRGQRGRIVVATNNGKTYLGYPSMQSREHTRRNRSPLLAISAIALFGIGAALANKFVMTNANEQSNRPTQLQPDTGLSEQARTKQYLLLSLRNIVERGEKLTRKYDALDQNHPDFNRLGEELVREKIALEREYREWEAAAQAFQKLYNDDSFRHFLKSEEQPRPRRKDQFII